MRAVLMFAACLASGPLLAIAGAPPPVMPEKPVLVILPPWRSAEPLVQAAHGRIIGLARAPFGVLAVGEGADFAKQLIAGGAWAVRDGRALAQLCAGTDA